MYYWMSFTTWNNLWCDHELGFSKWSELEHWILEEYGLTFDHQAAMDAREDDDYYCYKIVDEQKFTMFLLKYQL